jgi:pyridoxal phosphate enzyme (YggS family)
MHSVESIRRAIEDAAALAGREASSVRLVAVSKTHTHNEIEAAARYGIRDFGENYLQEALPKIQHLKAFQSDGKDLTWHFIGSVQSNKARDIARHFQWVHTVDRINIAKRLHSHRSGLAPLDVCIQVNIDAEPQKAGVSPDGVSALINTVACLDNLRLRGLMVIPCERSDGELVRPSFRRTAELFKVHKPAGGEFWDTLSMGMSSDYAIAIDEGATCVRIGTAIFGLRNLST